MNIPYYFFIIFSTLILTNSLVNAQDKANTIQFRGQVVDGPFKDQNISGFCQCNPSGDVYKQQTRCVVKLNNELKVVDTKASLNVVGRGRALRIILGPAWLRSTRRATLNCPLFRRRRSMNET